jgi:hypothetical protein
MLGHFPFSDVLNATVGFGSTFAKIFSKEYFGHEADLHPTFSRNKRAMHTQMTSSILLIIRNVGLQIARLPRLSFRSVSSQTPHFNHPRNILVLWKKYSRDLVGKNTAIASIFRRSNIAIHLV